MTLLALDQVSIRYGQRRVVDSVDMAIPAGGAFGLVGESGSGKSTLARAIAGLVPLDSGRILLDGADLRRARPSPVQMVFQNPAASLNPRRTAAQSVEEALEPRLSARSDRRDAIARYLALVGLSEAQGARRPAELSGGQKQRVAIARAVAAEPRLLIADEITSALDLSVQAAILNLMVSLRQQLGLTLLFISHNIAAVRYLCDTTAVMWGGRIVETAPSDQLVSAPTHDYTRTLLDAVPRFASTFDQETNPSA
jgi:peptide/nickel transport system ATP-binding protein